MVTRARSGLITAAVLSLTASACTTSVLGSDRSGDILVVALREAPDVLDPTLASTFVGRIVFAGMCEKLYDVDEGLNLVPQLASDLPEISEDGRTYTIPLREGVEFNDGTPFDAEAVKTSLERHRDLEESARAPELRPVEEIEVVDDSTVRLHLKTAFAPLTSILADRSGMILSPAQLQEKGEDFGDDPVCVGPFAFDSRPGTDEIHLTKSEFYYDADQVRLDGVTYRVVTASSVRVADMRAGDVDVADRLDPQDVRIVEDDPDTDVITQTSLGYQSLNLNVGNVNGSQEDYATADNPLAQDPTLREAFELSLDRDVINEVVFRGQYVPGCTPVPPESPFAPDITCSKRDVERAKTLVAESGVSTPIRVPLMISSDPLTIQLAQVVQAMAKEAGFDVRVEQTEFTTSLKNAQDGKFTTFQIGWSGRIDPDQNMFNMWIPGSAQNYTGSDFPDVSSLMERARTTVDQDERKQLYSDLFELMNEKRAIIYLYYPKLALGIHKGVTGVEFFGDGLIRLKNAQLDNG